MCLAQAAKIPHARSQRALMRNLGSVPNFLLPVFKLQPCHHEGGATGRVKRLKPPLRQGTTCRVQPLVEVNPISVAVLG